jgi:hypothetical protein
VGRASALLIGIAFVAPSSVRAQPAPMQTSPAEQPALGPLPEAVVETRSATWPLMLDVHALLGVEPHDRGSPVAFGAGVELLWRARVGGFAELLSSEGSPIIAPSANGVQQPGFADRISIPFGLATRPLAPFTVEKSAWWARLVSGIGVQVGVSIEHLRTSDDNATTAGLHAALGIDVPLYGGPKQGGVALRLYARALFTPSVSLDKNTVFEPSASGQLYAGLSYYP